MCHAIISKAAVCLARVCVCVCVCVSVLCCALYTCTLVSQFGGVYSWNVPHVLLLCDLASSAPSHHTQTSETAMYTL